MIPLPEELEKKIKAEAEKHMHDNYELDTDPALNMKWGYTAAATKYISDMEKLLEYSREAPGNTWQRATGEVLTTSELIIEFYRLKNK